MKLNIGSGGIHIEGFVSCDYDALANPDYLFDLGKDPFPFPDNSVEVVVASHVLEHLGEGYFHCLKELYRVCKHGAVIHINVPHHRNDYFADDPTHRRPITVDGLRLFSKKYNAVCKKQGVYASRLGDFFNVDFEILEFNYKPMNQYRAIFEGKPREEVERYIFEHNNVIEEVIIKLVVIKNNE